MDHFSEQAWADFERGFGASSKEQGIDAHLASGCIDCKAVHHFWSRLQAVANAESLYTPPENVVRMAKLEFVAHQQSQPDKWTQACLLFNSLSGALPAGIRSNGTGAWQVVYEAEGLTVDLRFDRKSKSRTISVVGQILDSRLQHGPLSSAVILLWMDEGQLVASTGANEFGEFQLEFEPQDHLRLTARVGSRKVQIPLADFK